MFDFQCTGAGPALLFLPGSYGHYSAWRDIQSSLSGQYRLISTSLPGYGGSLETRSKHTNDTTEMIAFVEWLIKKIGEPVHLIGHSFGGLVSLASVLDGRSKPLSMITFEANPLYALPDSGPRPFDVDLNDLTRRFRAALDAKDPKAASIIIDFYSQPGMFQSMPETFQKYCEDSAPTNRFDWQVAEGFTPRYSEFSAIQIPYTIVRGEHAVPSVKNITEQLIRHAPQSRSEVVLGANHFLITTHAKDCAKIIDTHMQLFG